MPKIIENPEARILAEAKRLADTEGYSAVTIRAVAAGSGMGVGTVYNYFPSKDDVLAALVLSEWQKCVEIFQHDSDTAETPQAALLAIYAQMREFGHTHRSVIYSPESLSAFAAPHSTYNAMLLSQITRSIRRFCCNDYTASFIAQSLFSCTLMGHAFEDIYSVLEKLF